MAVPTRWRQIFEQSEAGQSNPTERSPLQASTSRDVVSGISHPQRSAQRYHPYQRPDGSSGSQGTSGRQRSATFKLGSSDVELPCARYSWFPTPDEMNAARKGYLGHWTQRVERMYDERLSALAKDICVPKSASQWGKEVFGSVSKHVLKGASHGAHLVVQDHAKMSETHA